MMGGGIDFRADVIFPDIFAALFYSALGCALVLAGVLFLEIIFAIQNYRKGKLQCYGKRNL